MRAFSKSRLFRSLASSVSLRTCPLASPFEVTSVLFVCFLSIKTSPFACFFEVSLVPFACFLNQSEDKPLCVPFRSHVYFVRLLP